MRQRRVPFSDKFWVACGTLVIFWLCRSAVCEGDGDQIARFIEAGIWFIRTEILSQAVFQIVYRICSVLRWDGLLVMNLVSCLSGAILVYFFLRIGEMVGEVRFALPVVLSSGFIVLACGHTEYYPQLLAALAAWNWSCIRYLRGQGTLLLPSILFSLCVWLHQEALFAFPVQFLLLFFRRDRDRWIPWILGLLPLGLLLIVRFVPHVTLLRLDGMSHGWNTVPLWTTEGTEKLYSMFEWAHWCDVLYALGQRSILAWPVIIIGLLVGRRCTGELAENDSLRKVRLFLFIECACFWILCVVWHPNLGIEADWDLFAVEAIPSTILALSFIPRVAEGRVLCLCVVCAMLFSGLVTWQGIFERARFGHRGRGNVEIQVQGSKDLLITFDGHQKGKEIASVLAGRHYLKLIDPVERWKRDYIVLVAPGRSARVIVSNTPDVSPTQLPERDS
ncbi:MAG: hypothetical protein ABIH23_14630 [bacterium]